MRPPSVAEMNKKKKRTFEEVSNDENPNSSTSSTQQFVIAKFPSMMPRGTDDFTVSVKRGSISKDVRQVEVITPFCTFTSAPNSNNDNDNDNNINNNNNNNNNNKEMRNLVVICENNKLKVFTSNSASNVFPLSQSVDTFKSSNPIDLGEISSYTEKKKDLWDSFGSAKAARALVKASNNEIATQNLSTSSALLKSTLDTLKQRKETNSNTESAMAQSLKLSRENLLPKYDISAECAMDIYDFEETIGHDSWNEIRNIVQNWAGSAGGGDYDVGQFVKAKFTKDDVKSDEKKKKIMYLTLLHHIHTFQRKIKDRKMFKLQSSFSELAEEVSD